MMKIQKRVLLFAAAGILMSSAIFAQEQTGQKGLDLDNMAKDADYIFKGTVVGVEYRFSESTPENPGGIPHTFVTYKVDQEYKNQNGSKEITLRFTGGKIDDDNFLLGEGVPLMDVGDKDLLYVKGNGQYPCPLVSCQKGRFREIEGYVYDDTGHAIELNSEGRLERGEVVPLEAVKTHKMSDTLNLELEEIDAGNEEVLPVARRELGDEKRFRPDAANFDAIVQESVISSHTPDEMNNPAAFKNQDPDQPFIDRVFSTSQGAKPKPDMAIGEDFPEEDIDPEVEDALEGLEDIAAAPVKTLSPAPQAAQVQTPTPAAEPAKIAQASIAISGDGRETTTLNKFIFLCVVLGFILLAFVIKRRLG